MSRAKSIAYFCMEYGLHESFPIYSGGLGVLAGDTMKAAGDLKSAFVGIGILWDEGYTVQKIDAEGRPYDQYPKTPRDRLKILISTQLPPKWVGFILRRKNNECDNEKLYKGS